MAYDVLVVGELLADVISTDYVYSLSDSHTFAIYQGGSPSNVCATLKWLGTKSVIVSAVGEDDLGNYMIRSIKQIGLSSEYITRVPYQPTSLVLISRSKDTPKFIPYRLADKYIPPIPEDLIQHARLIHTCAFALSEDPAQTHILHALKTSAALGKDISVDWNFAKEIWKENDGKKVFDELCSYHPLIKFSMDDLRRFLNNSQLSIEAAKSFLNTLQTVKLVCLTCGSIGVWYKIGNNPVWSFTPALQISDIKDTTGAGDAFWAGFLNAYLKEYDLQACVDNGIQIASMKLQKVGPIYV